MDNLLQQITKCKVKMLVCIRIKQVKSIYMIFRNIFFAIKTVSNMKPNLYQQGVLIMFSKGIYCIVLLVCGFLGRDISLCINGCFKKHACIFR